MHRGKRGLPAFTLALLPQQSYDVRLPQLPPHFCKSLPGLNCSHNRCLQSSIMLDATQVICYLLSMETGDTDMQAQIVTLTGFYTATGSSRRVIHVDLENGTATEIKAMRRTGKRYEARITNPARLAKLVEMAKKQAGR